MRRRAGAGLAALLALLGAACGEAPGGEAGTAAADTAITAVHPWVRMAIVPQGDTADAPPVTSAAYLTIRNPTDEADALLAVETDVADTAEIHTVSRDGDVMRMRPVDSLAVPATGEAVLEPGGYHIMLIGLHAPLVEGDSVALRLRLRSGSVLDITAPVGRGPPE